MRLNKRCSLLVTRAQLNALTRLNKYSYKDEQIEERKTIMKKYLKIITSLHDEYGSHVKIN